MAKLKLDLHDIFDQGDKIERALDDVMRQAVEKKIRLVEIIPGKGSGQLKKRVLRFLAQKHIQQLYRRVEKDDKNFGRIFVHLKFGILLGMVFLGVMAADLYAQGDHDYPVQVSSDWREPVRLGFPVNSPAWEDSPGISPDGTMLFFSRGRYDSSDINVYYSVKVNGEWTKPVFAKFNLETYPTSAVKPQDDNTVYFASIRPGGYGHGDIYVSEKLPDGTWDAGKNVGAPINTEYNESEPYVSPDGERMYFTSNRPGGLGGMDTWVSVKIDGKWTEPVNLGAPANSSYDDLQPFVTADGKSLYFVRMNFDNSGIRVGGYHAAIYRSDRSSGRWSEPAVVVADYVGEPSLTADGRTLYFVRVIFSGGYPVDADIMMAEHR